MRKGFIENFYSGSKEGKSIFERRYSILQKERINYFYPRGIKIFDNGFGSREGMYMSYLYALGKWKWF